MKRVREIEVRWGGGGEKGERSKMEGGIDSYGGGGGEKGERSKMEGGHRQLWPLRGPLHDQQHSIFFKV